MRRSATPDTKNHKKTPFILQVAINYVETYFSSNAAAQDPDRREKTKQHTLSLHIIQGKKISQGHTR